MLDAQVAAVRRFNRFYTQQVGALGERVLDGPMSLAELRVLYELAHREGLTASVLSRELGLDQGYLSRIVARFVSRGLVGKSVSPTDVRQRLLCLTQAGRALFDPFERATQQEIAAMLGAIAAADRDRLVSAMRTIESLLGRPDQSKVPYLIRPPHCGDLGWVIHRHGALYAAEYGWDESFEALVAQIVADFTRNCDGRRERCWIAERDGEVAGSVFLVRQGDQVGKLRLLYVEPSARGLGIGARLVDECIRGARQAGYAKLVLWTNDILVSARKIYLAAGFRLAEEERHHSFGHDLVGQYWELAL